MVTPRQGPSADGSPWVDEDPTPQSKQEAERAIAEGIDISGTAAERYLREQRGIDMPFPSHLKYWANARPAIGEAALTAPLFSADGSIVAVQVTYVDITGRRSLIQPQRKRLSLKKAPEATFSLPYNGDSADVFVTEGLEDSLVVWRYAATRCRVIGLPGVAALRHLTFPQDTKITVVADPDPVGSKGAELLQKGLDHLILLGCEVLLTQLTETIHKFIVLTQEQAHAVAIWVIFTWCFAAAESAPKLWVKSVKKRSGKTRLMRLLRYLVKRAMGGSKMSRQSFTG